MRSLKVAVLWLLLVAISIPPYCSGQGSGPAVADESGRLPVTRVILYKNGVGYFEHGGRVRGSQDVNVDFTTAQLNDVLKSLTVLDLGKGRITGSATTPTRRWRGVSALCICRWARIRRRRSSLTRCAERVSRCATDRKALPDACSALTSAKSPLKATRKLR